MRTLWIILVFGFLGDTCTAADMPITFDAAVEKIIFRSTGVAISEANLGQVKAQNLPTRMVFLPTLTLSGRTPLNGVNSFAAGTESIEISSQLNVFRWGADWKANQAANAEQDSQRSQIAVSVLTVEAQGVAALVAQIQRKKEVDVNASIVRNRTELLNVAQERFKRGYLPLQEVEKLSVDLEIAQANLKNSEINETEARFQLENLLGDSKVSMDWPWTGVMLDPKKQVELKKRELNLEQRPDWLAVSYKVKASDHRVSQRWRSLLPSVDLQASYGSYRNFFGTVSGWVGAATFTFPIFDQLTHYSKAREESFVMAAAESQMEQTARNAKSEWESARTNFQKALDTALARDRTLTLSRKLFQDNLKRFQAGRISANDLAIDQDRMYNSELLAIQGWSAAHLNFTRLCHSFGFRVKDCFQSQTE